MTQRLSIAGGSPPADRDEGSILFLGTPTVVVGFGGFTVLIDPGFLDHGDHVHLGYDVSWSSPKEPATGSEQLPPIDFVLLSQPQASRSDRVVERELDRHVPILTTPRAGKSLRQKGFVGARGLAAWETIRVERADVAVRLTAMPARHGSVSDDFMLPDSMDAMVEFASEGDGGGLRLYVSGDARAHEHVRDLPRRAPGLDLALLQLGGTRVLGIPLAADTEDGSAMRLVGPRVPVAVGGDFEASPSVEELASALRQRGLEAHTQFVAHGERHVFRHSRPPASPALSPEAAAREASEAGGPRTAAPLAM